MSTSGPAAAVAAVCVSLILSLSGARAQEPRAVGASAAPAPGDVRLDRTLVTLDVTVQDDRGRFVEGLAGSQFEVFDDKVRQAVAFFREEDVPVTLGIVCDASGSMKLKMRRAALALERFVETCHPEDEFFVIGFNHGVELLRDFSSDPSVAGALAGVEASGSTALYDAVMAGIEKARQGRHRKRALLIVSDGQDNHSRYTFKELRETAREADVIVYGIGISQDNDSLAPFGESVLGEVCRITGGAAYFPRSSAALADFCTYVALELRRQYTLGYYPTDDARDGRWHKVRVKVATDDGSKVAVRTREGYYGARR